MYSLNYSSQSSGFLRKSQQKLQKQIKIKLEKLIQDPFAPNPNATKMKDLEQGYRLRVGNYRMIYEVDSKTQTVIIWKIDHRSSVYKQ